MNRAMRVRVSGPLAPYADGFRTVLAERGYTPSSAAGQLQLMAHLSRWLVERGLGGQDLTPAEVEGFLQARRAAGSRQWLSSRGMSPLLGYLREVGFAASGSPVVASTPMEILLADYRDYLVSERGLAASTVRNYVDVARRFVLDRSAWGRTDLGGLTAAEVSEFVLTNCRARSTGSATLLVVGTRALLRYLYLAGLTPNRLAGTVPSAACWPASSLPRPIEPGEAARLMRSWASSCGSGCGSARLRDCSCATWTGVTAKS